MAFTTLVMQNPLNGDYKNAPIGFSWTSLFFGGFVPLFRKHYSGAIWWMLLMIITVGLSLLVQMFVYNKQYLKFLIAKGYQVKHSSFPLEIVASRVNMAIPEAKKS